MTLEEKASLCSGQDFWHETYFTAEYSRYYGVVMSDWGAVNIREEGLAAGLELEMPPSGGLNDKCELLMRSKTEVCLKLCLIQR